MLATPKCAPLHVFFSISVLKKQMKKRQVLELYGHMSTI